MPKNSNQLDGKALIGFVEKIEGIVERRKGLADDEKAILVEAKKKGFAAKFLKLIVKARALKPGQFQEYDDVRTLYFHAAGLLPDLPLFQHFDNLRRDGLGRDALTAAILELVPAGSSIITDFGGGLVRLSRDMDGNTSATEIDLEQLATAAPGAATKH